jgi:hypothetical protein
MNDEFYTDPLTCKHEYLMHKGKESRWCCICNTRKTVNERIAALEEAHKANLHQEISTVQYTERGHRCSWRAAYEAVVQRSNSVLKAI